MYLTATCKLLPDKKQKQMLLDIADKYLISANFALDQYILHGKDKKLTTADIPVLLPAAVKQEAISVAKQLYNKYLNMKRDDELYRILNNGLLPGERIPYLKKQHIRWQKDTFYVLKDKLSIPGWSENGYERTEIRAILPDELYEKLRTHKLYSLYVTFKKEKVIAKIIYEVPEPETKPVLDKPEIMGIDLNLICPAVAVTSSGKVLFAGSGRELRYMHRHFKTLRTAYRKTGNYNKLSELSHKEENYMIDKDHKISREIVDFAINNKVTEIHIEKLYNLRKTMHATSKRKRDQIHAWSFYRLTEFIRYKAELAGISVVFVPAEFTSQKCPKCGTLNRITTGSIYSCSNCGYRVHKDIAAAINIRDSKPLIDINKPVKTKNTAPR